MLADARRSQDQHPVFLATVNLLDPASIRCSAADCAIERERLRLFEPSGADRPAIEREERADSRTYVRRCHDRMSASISTVCRSFPQESPLFSTEPDDCPAGIGEPSPAEASLSSDESSPRWRGALVYSVLDVLAECVPASNGSVSPVAAYVSLLPGLQLMKLLALRYSGPTAISASPSHRECLLLLRSRALSASSAPLDASHKVAEGREGLTPRHRFLQLVPS